MLYSIFLFFLAFLPLQFALNLLPGIDLALVRVIIPMFFLACLAVQLKNKKEFISKNKLTYCLLAFVFLAVFSFLFSQNFFWSTRKLLFLFSIIPVYFAAISILDTKEKQRTAIGSLVLGGTAAAFFGLIQFFSQFFFGIDSVYSFLAKNISPFFLGNSFSEAVLAHPSWLINSADTTYMRAVANFPDPHMFSYYLGMLLPWSIALWATTRSHKNLFLISSLLLATADIFTFTRGGYIALIASALIVLPLVPKQAVKKIILGIAMLALLLAIVPQNPISGRFVSSFDLQEGSNQERMENWRQALAIIASHPQGVGIGMYSLAVNPNANYRDPIYAHNLYLDIAAELGLIALVVFLGILLQAFANFWSAAKEDLFFIAGVSSLTLFAVHSLVESPLYSVHVLPLFLIIIALSTLSKKHEENPIPR